MASVLTDFITDRPVAYHPMLAKCVGGVKAAIMLCQLLYWAQGKTAKSRDGWFYKSVAEMEEETGLSQSEQQTARDKLDDLGIIDSKLKGIPRNWHYRVNIARLEQVVIERHSHWTEITANGGGDLPPILEDISSQLNKNQETTQETTHLGPTAPPTEDDPYIPVIYRQPNPQPRKTAATKKGDPMDGMLAYARAKDPIAEYPPDVQDVIRPLKELWKLDPPQKTSRKGGEFARWIADARDLREACGDQNLYKVLQYAYRDWEKNSFLVSGPGSLLKAARAAAAKIRRHNDQEQFTDVYQ